MLDFFAARCYRSHMKFLKKLFHPLITFIAIQLVWIILVFFWVYWFVNRHKELRRLVKHYRPDLVGYGKYDWLILTEGILLLLVILIGVYVIFLFWNRQARLYKQQKQFVSQVTHELKSPLASIQLHLETIRLRHPSPDKMNAFIDTMLSDTNRLHHLITNLLTAGQIELQKDRSRHIVDFSSFVTGYFEKRRLELGAGCELSLDVEPDIVAEIDQENMEMVLRNLLENAILYSPLAPEVHVSLRSSGKNLIFTIKDNGRGMELKDLKRIFSMFYRVRRPGDNIRGSGLGLYIVKSVIKDHKGRVSASSEGPGKGCTFQITLPVAKNRRKVK